MKKETPLFYLRIFTRTIRKRTSKRTTTRRRTKKHKKSQAFHECRNEGKIEKQQDLVSYFFGEPGEEVSSPEEVQDQVELPFSLER